MTKGPSQSLWTLGTQNILGPSEEQGMQQDQETSLLFEQ